MNIRLIHYGLVFGLLAVTNNAWSEDINPLKNDTDKSSYSIGQQIGSDLKKQNIDLNETILRRGISDGLNDNPPLVPPREMTSRLTQLKKKITSQLNEDAVTKVKRRRQQEAEIRASGKAYMQQNAKKEGVTTLKSGLQYRVIKTGQGNNPQKTDMVEVEYRARTVDGREFDSSFKHGKPYIFKVDGVMQGFTEAIQLMQPGAKWEIVMPPELAYGRRGMMAHQTIILELELLSIQPQQQQAKTREK